MFKRIMKWMKNNESGQGMVEYGLITALIAVDLRKTTADLALSAWSAVFGQRWWLWV